MITIAGKPISISQSKDTHLQKTIEEGRKLLTKNKEQSETTEFRTKTACMTRGEMSSFTEITGSTIKAASIRTKELTESQLILQEKSQICWIFRWICCVTDDSINRIKEYI
jgi:hypothetical protein